MQGGCWNVSLSHRQSTAAAAAANLVAEMWCKSRDQRGLLWVIVGTPLPQRSLNCNLLSVDPELTRELLEKCRKQEETAEIGAQWR